MKNLVFCTAGDSKALFFAKNRLVNWGYRVLPEPAADATHLLLPVPTPPGILPASLPEGITVLGGNLGSPAYTHGDFLQDEFYLRENADITALCALELARERLYLGGAAVLIIGWGRIGKCLVSRLQALGARVTVAARRQETREALAALDIASLPLPLEDARGFDLIFNTAPAPVLHQDATDTQTVLIDLASRKGMEGSRVLWARGLPGKMAPEASGALIAKTALRYALGKE